MNIMHDMLGMDVSGTAPTHAHIKGTKTQKSQQDASISAYASSFFKGLGTWFQEKQDASLVRSQLNKVVKERDIVKKADKSSKENTPATPGNYLSLLVGMESGVKTLQPKVLKDRSITNLFCRAKAKEISQILSSGETKIQITTAYKNDETNELEFEVTDAKGLPSIQEIIDTDIKQLESRTKAQKVYDFACSWFFGGSDAEKALSTLYKNREALNLLKNPEAKLISLEKRLSKCIMDWSDLHPTKDTPGKILDELRKLRREHSETIQGSLDLQNSLNRVENEAKARLNVIIERALAPLVNETIDRIIPKIPQPKTITVEKESMFQKLVSKAFGKKDGQMSKSASIDSNDSKGTVTTGSRSITPTIEEGK